MQHQVLMTCHLRIENVNSAKRYRMAPFSLLTVSKAVYLSVCSVMRWAVLPSASLRTLISPPKQQTNCTPWDYPSPNGVDHSPLCTSYFDGKNYFNNLKSFDMVMRDSAVSDNCSSECLPNCEQVTYKWTMDTTDLDPHTLCHNEPEMREVMLQKLRQNLGQSYPETYS